jgi:hypothetical protein
VDSVFLVLMGVGGFMMYEAYKNPAPAPLTKALSVLNGTSAATTVSGPAPTTNTAGQSVPENLTQAPSAG